MATFGQIITKLREDSMQKRQETADALGISRASLEYYEKDKRKPDIEVLTKIADYYHVSADYLLGRTNVKTTDKDLQFVCEYTGLTEESVNNLRKCLLFSEDVSIPQTKEHMIIHKIFWLNILINISSAEEMFFDLSEFVCGMKRSREEGNNTLEKAGQIHYAEFQLYRATKILTEIAESMLSIDIPELEEITAKYNGENIKELKEMLEYVQQKDGEPHGNDQ